MDNNLKIYGNTTREMFLADGTYIDAVCIVDANGNTVSMSNPNPSQIIYVNGSSVSNSTATSVNIPSTFYSGFIQWTNSGTGTVRIITTDSNGFNLSLDSPSISYLPINGIKYSGYSISLTGGATIQWSFLI
jgi:hypothetical protein